MAENNSDSESSHSSQCDSEFDFIPGYIIEEETNDTATNKTNTFGAANEENLDDYGAYAYADEPLAGEEWLQQYNKKCSDQKKETEKLERRLNGLEDTTTWCNCGNCVITHLQNPREARCCQEIEACVAALKDNLILEDVPQMPCCITKHPGFRPVCLEKWSLRMSARKYKTRDRRRYKQTGSEEMFLRSIAYREFTTLVHGYLGEERRALPACAYNAIRVKFSDKKEQFRGFDDNETI